jgi:putative FmdB family regulatory protein
MPTYEYACTACGHQFEAHQSFSDEPLAQCPECKGALRKVYGGVGIVFKGSGFYKTDSRGSSSSSSSGSSSSGSEASSSAASSSGSESSASSSTAGAAASSSAD